MSLSKFLIHRVTVDARQRASDGQGGSTIGWVPDAIPARHARVEGLSGDEAIKSAVERSVLSWRVTVRKSSSPITSEHRLTWEGLVMDVQSVMPHPKHPLEAQLLICESGASASGL